MAENVNVNESVHLIKYLIATSTKFSAEPVCIKVLTNVRDKTPASSGERRKQTMYVTGRFVQAFNGMGGGGSRQVSNLLADVVDVTSIEGHTKHTITQAVARVSPKLSIRPRRV